MAFVVDVGVLKLLTVVGGWPPLPSRLVSIFVATIAGWNWLLDWLSFHFTAVRRLTDPPPLVLVRRGRINARTLRREFITVPELMAGLREQGVEKLAQVKMARLETDGRMTVIRTQDG